MVTPLSDGGGGGVARALAPFAAVFGSGLLVVTNLSGAASLVDGFDFGGGAATAFGLAGAGAGAGAGFAGLATLTGFAGAFLAAAVFFTTAGFLTTALATGFVALLRGGTDLSGLFAGAAFAAGFFALALDAGLRAALAAADVGFLAFAGAFAVFARAAGFALLFAILKSIL